MYPNSYEGTKGRLPTQLPVLYIAYISMYVRVHMYACVCMCCFSCSLPEGSLFFLNQVNVLVLLFACGSKLLLQKHRDRHRPRQHRRDTTEGEQENSQASQASNEELKIRRDRSTTGARGRRRRAFLSQQTTPLHR